MPWKEVSPMDEKVKFIAAVCDGSVSISTLCEAFGISRKTGYKWLSRYRKEGPGGLLDKSKTPHSNPNRVGFAEERMILGVRKDHPTWGPLKIRAFLENSNPDLIWPAVSTIGSILQKRGLVKPRKKRQGMGRYSEPFKGYDHANAVWCADFKGDFKLKDGIRCYPLTISDGYSRFLLCCKGLSGTRTYETKKEFERCFREYGLPNAIRTDNGIPFAAGLGISLLSTWWIKLGILPERIQPGKPQENGRHERMHRTLKAEAVYPIRSNMKQQQKSFDRFRTEYNYERPHEALGQKPPSEFYQASKRSFPNKIQEVTYPDHFEVRKVDDGNFYWKNKRFFITKSLGGEHIGFEPVEDGIWTIYFSFVKIGIFNERKKKVSRILKV
ncbi:integrase core domain-containing protein [Leptospira dzoumogneensis]|uniref:integrase core domain-containing protein n=1 Tax=Leptospira dzoumogneensis TaxID=2484904 RepID=UPI003CC5DC7E